MAQAHELTAFHRMVKGFRRLSKKPQAYEAFPISALAKAVLHWNKDIGYNAQLKRSILQFAFTTMCRVGEYTAESWYAESALTFKQLKFEPNLEECEVLTIHWNKSKTNQFGDRKDIAVLRCNCRLGVCGLHAMKDWCKYRSKAKQCDAVFSFSDGVAVRGHHMNTFVAEAARIAGLRKHYTSHCLRAGGASWLFERGFNLTIVERLGRWANDSAALRKCYIQFQVWQAAKLVEAIH